MELTDRILRSWPGPEAKLWPAEPLSAQVAEASQPSQAEPRLGIGHVYTRVELQQRFSITDATLRNGVFPFRERHEIWLFVTEQKAADPTPYKDELVGDTLSVFHRCRSLVAGQAWSLPAGSARVSPCDRVALVARPRIGVRGWARDRHVATGWPV